MPAPRFLICICLCAALAIPGSANAESASSLSLGQVLAAAVRQNPDLQRASIDIERANATAFEAAGIDDWLLAASLGLFIDRNEAVAGNVTGTNRLDAYSVSAEVSRLLSTGGRVGVGFTGRRRDTVFRVVDDQETTDYTEQLTVSLDQPLLRGRGQKVARASLRQTKLAEDAASLDRAAQIRSLLRQVIHAYWDVALTWENLTIRQGTLGLAKERRRITDAAIDAGTVAPTEALAVEQIITTREEEILDAELSITQSSLDLRRLAFLEIGPRAINVKPTGVVKAPTRSFDEAALIERAIAQSPEIAALRARGEGATIEVEVNENGILPRLDLSFAIGPQGTDSTMSRATENLAKLKGYSITAGLTYEQQLRNRGARGKALRARADRRRITIDERAAKQQVAMAMARAVRLARSARKRMELGERTVALAERNIEAEQARFELGRATNFDVLQRQDELKQARLRYARSTVDFLKAEATIDSLTGDLLDKYGIKIEGR